MLETVLTLGQIRSTEVLFCAQIMIQRKLPDYLPCKAITFQIQVCQKLCQASCVW